MHAAVSFDDRPPAFTSERLLRLARRLAPFVDVAGLLVGAGCLLALLFQHFQLITQPSPHEFNESAEWYTTFLLDQGRNPYTVAEITGSAVFFGPLYHWVVIAFKPLFGLGYPAHRMVNFLCVAATLWLLGTRMRRLGASRGVTLCSAALFYGISLQNIMTCARPDALGLLLFLLAIILPWEKHYTRPTVAVSLALTLLAFHCKAYFLLSLLPTLAGVAVTRSWRESLVWALGFAAALAASLAALNHFFPLYYIETFIMQKNSVWANSQDPEIAVMHTHLLLTRTWPYLLLLAFAAGPFLTRLWHRWRGQPGAAAADATRDRALALMAGLFVFHLLLVDRWMGVNGGASYTYHLHLIYPPMFLLAAAATADLRARVLFGATLAALTFSELHLQTVPDASPGYHRLKEIVEANDPVLDSTSVAIEWLATNGRPIHNNGYTLCLPFVTMWDRFKWDPQAEAIRQAYERVVEDAEARIAAHDYKVILTTDDRCYFGQIETVHAHYEVVERVELPMFFGASPVEIWKPKAGVAPVRVAP